jgi:glycosyltransferase involved in cell wall biosynthesis
MWFAQEVLPILPINMRLKVVGRKPNSIEIENALLQLGANKNIDFIFDVNDCNPYYERALAAIVPIMSGGGTKLKMLEAFANHCPVISTSKGIEGLNIKNGNEVFIANIPNEFLDAILKIQKNSKNLTAAAYQYLTENHTQKIVQERILKSLTQKRF